MGCSAGADVVMTLTTRDHTMLRGAYEAIYQGTPVIVSDWGLLARRSRKGPLHVDNTPTGIAGAIRPIERAARGRYKDGAARLRESKRLRWEATRSAVVARLSAARRPPASRGHGS